MDERDRSWPPRGRGGDTASSGREDRGPQTASWPPPTARLDREVAASSWPPGRETDREREADREDGGPRVQVAKRRGGSVLAVPDGREDDDREDDGPPLPGFLSWIEEWRFVRDTTNTRDHIDYAIGGAYTLPDGVWRIVNIAFAYTVGLVGALACDAIKWSFFTRLSRTIIAIPTALALAYLLNRVPLVGWLVPDGLDWSTWGQPDPATVVEVPVDGPPIGEG